MRVLKARPIYDSKMSEEVSTAPPAKFPDQLPKWSVAFEAAVKQLEEVENTCHGATDV